MFNYIQYISLIFLLNCSLYSQIRSVDIAIKTDSIVECSEGNAILFTVRNNTSDTLLTTDFFYIDGYLSISSSFPLDDSLKLNMINIGSKLFMPDINDIINDTDKCYISHIICFPPNNEIKLTVILLKKYKKYFKDIDKYISIRMYFALKSEMDSLIFNYLPEYYNLYQNSILYTNSEIIGKLRLNLKIIRNYDNEFLKYYFDAFKLQGKYIKNFQN